MLQIRGRIAGATAPELTAFSREIVVADDSGAPSGQGNALGLFRKVRNFTYSLVGAGVTEIDNIPREAFAMAIHLIQTTGNVTNVECWVDNVRVWDASDARMESVVERAGRVRQANVYHLDWMLRNELGNQLTLAGTQDFRLKVTHSGSDTLNAYVEYLSDFATA